jgi:anaphase-promoting complex subunit 6
MLVYVACMIELHLKTELFYLGHELVSSCPKSAVSWYTVGCYYWSCKKLELARKYLQKSTKMDRKFAKAWTALGHVLCSLEESEQAIASYRSASRLLPGDHRPLLYMAKELVRTNYVSLALHLLATADGICASTDPLLLNEMGVAFYKNGDLDRAAEYLGAAINALYSTRVENGAEIVGDKGKNGGCAFEVTFTL